MDITPLHQPSPPPQLPQLPPDALPPPEEPYNGGSPDSSNEGLRSIVSTLLILIAAPLIALSLTAFVFQSYEVDGPSMETTLDNHDRLIVLKVPVTMAKLTGDPFIPDRGEIIVFTKPGSLQFGEEGEKQLIKRVVGLPGERIVVNDGVVTVYNDKHPQGFQPDRTLPYGDVIGKTAGRVDITLGSNEIFVLGDNRSNSLDSRAFGSVNSEDIVGALSMRILPLSKAQKF